MEDKKKFAIASIIMAIISLVPTIILPSELKVAQVLIAVAILLGLLGIIFGIIGIKASKALSISGIVVGIISCVFLSMSLFGLAIYDNATDCVDNGDGTSTCIAFGVETELENNMLREDQKKK